MIDTIIENKIHFGKAIDAAFLLIAPEFEDPEETGRALKELCPQIGTFLSLNQMVSTIAKTICAGDGSVRSIRWSWTRDRPVDILLLGKRECGGRTANLFMYD